MVTSRRSLIFSSAAVVLLSAGLFAQGGQPPQRKLTDAEKKEIQTVPKMVDEIVAGKPAPNDLSLEWVREDLLKAMDSQQYVPFIVSLDPTKITGGKVTLYWRVAAKAPAATATAEPAQKDAKTNEKPAFAYEDLHTVAVPSGQTGPLRISRSFTVPAGMYDVYVVAKEPTPEKSARNAPPLKVSVIKHEATVPDLWNGELNTSSVLVAERIDPLPVELTPQQQSERPYALGPMEILPASSNVFAKTRELSTFLLIYNPKTDAANKPDVSVEYSFYAKQNGEEKFFNKTNPQPLNAQTLPAQFDFALGHQLQTGQAVRLASFPEGEYRLEIKVTDKIANKTVTRNVNFTVSGS